MSHPPHFFTPIVSDPPHFSTLIMSRLPHFSTPIMCPTEALPIPSHHLPISPFTPVLMEEAILKSNNSTATGPDGLTVLHLKHLGPAGTEYHTDLFNLSVRNAVVPAIWKTALVIPVPKPGKLVDKGASYRPISLLSPVVKILERLFLPSLTSALQASPTQHGFRLDRSTITASLLLASQVSEGFSCNKPAKRIATVAINISKAFNLVDTTLLLQQISNLDLQHDLVRWLSAYLHGRTAACIYQGARSKFRTVHVRVPQGFVLSPCLFNYITSDFPVVSNLLASFADNFTIGALDSSLV
jgi:hypothetical protein